MKKVTYVTAKVVPYRTRFFNILAQACDLTVIYEKKNADNRDDAWCLSEEIGHKHQFLPGGGITTFASFLKLLKRCWNKNNVVIFGCFNSKVQLAVMQLMRLFRKTYYLNFDGEIFADGNSLKSKAKRFLMNGASGYFVAGETSAQHIRNYVKAPVFSYPFSSLSDSEIVNHRNQAKDSARNDVILVIGQYFDYKGMDVALEAAKMDLSIQYKFIGMGKRTELFRKEHQIPNNVELISFLQKEALEEEYKNCAVFVLPSRQECWGLVVNEAASFGTPIVSTWGSGAAVEFLGTDYPQLLAQPGNPKLLLDAIKKCLAFSNSEKENMGKYLLDKSSLYSVEKSVEVHFSVINNS